MKSKLEIPRVAVFGASSYDITATFNGDIIDNDSNPAKIYGGCGGAGRNIAENLSRMGVPTGIVTALGTDSYSELLKSSLRLSEVEMEASYIEDGRSANIYISFLDTNGELVLAASDFEFMENIPEEKIVDIIDYLNQFEIVFMDSNASEEMLLRVAQSIDSKIFVDTVSVAKAGRFKGLFSYIHTIKANKLEFETLIGRKVETEEEIIEGINFLFEKGVKRVFVTLGEKGALVGNEDEVIFIDGIETKVRNATGAGDSFSSAVALGCIKGMTDKNILLMATAAAQITLEEPRSVCKGINFDILMERYDKISKIAKIKEFKR